jgi:hypothetical protein
MFNLFPHAASHRPIHRRDALRLGGLTALGATLPLAEASLAATGQQTHAATAKRCIYIFLCGGPSHIDMWDLKPDAPEGIRGPFKPISTNVPGIQFGELLPQVSQHADKMAIIRSMTHGTTSHDTGIMYTLLADSRPPTNAAYPPVRSDHPGMGAILKSLLGDSPDLPCWVTVPRPFTTGDRFYKGQSGGFLGPTHDPFLLDEEKKDSLSEKPFDIESLLLRDSLNSGRLVGRRELLSELNSSSDRRLETQATNNLRNYFDKASAMLSADGFGGVFDLDRESAQLRDRYGRNEYGQSFLMARRLAEADVRMVNVFWTYYGKDGCQFNLWDNHGSDKEVCGGYSRGVDMIKGDYCCPAFDRAFSALLEDLTERGMLDDTLVVATGEFGRTPKINKNAGRDHWGACYSTILAGGGIRGGQIYGSSDNQAAYVKDSPTRPEDVGATMLHAFGFPPEAEIFDPTGRPVRSSKGTPVTALF